MKKILTVCLISTSLFTLIQCGSASEKSSNKPTELVDAARFDTLMCDRKNAGNSFSVVGYPNIGGDFMVDGDNLGKLYVSSKPNDGGDHSTFNVKMGVGKNTMTLPDNFTVNDLKVYDFEGNILTSKDKIKITFTLDMDSRDTVPYKSFIFLKGNKKKDIMMYSGLGAVVDKIEKAQ
jgi:hypothetical protein